MTRFRLHDLLAVLISVAGMQLGFALAERPEPGLALLGFLVGTAAYLFGMTYCLLPVWRVRQMRGRLRRMDEILSTFGDAPTTRPVGKTLRSCYHFSDGWYARDSNGVMWHSPDGYQWYVKPAKAEIVDDA